jgi:oxalate decarboxylase
VTINRRKVLGGAGLTGAGVAAGAGFDRLVSVGTSGYRTDKVEPMSDDAARWRSPPTRRDDHLAIAPVPSRRSAPTTHDGGSYQQANEEDFPILKGQEASILLPRLQSGGIRQPHWQPSAWEINLVTSGVAT